MAKELANIRLNDGNEMPRLGFGVWQVPDSSVAAAVGEALRTGYRSIDTAQGYENEEGVGKAIAASAIARSELFITTKLRNGQQGYDSALKAFDLSMEKLGLDVLDLFLIHWPVPSADKYVETWKAFARLREEGRVRSIGVSNFNADHLTRIMGETGAVPAVNQIELHPGFQQQALRDIHAAHGIAIECYSPLGRGTMLSNPVIMKIAAKHGVSPAQAIIRWHLDQGFIVIPKSTTPVRIAENFNVFGFTLDAEDRNAIAALDDAQGKLGPDPATFAVMF